MPAPAQPIFPALYLYPLNDSFIPKHISLAHGQRVKIGRQTNAKTAPGERNGYFDSKVLSRQHAEVWEEGGKIFIKDVKSSNGTFINGDRLSGEGLESEPNELKNDDIVEFGIDIVGDDNKTVIHHKVAARVVCVYTEHDVQVAARVEQIGQHNTVQQQFQVASASASAPAPSPAQQQQPNGAAFPFQQRRPQMTQQGMAAMGSMGGMGGGLRQPGKGGLTFDHILSRLQGELQKSRETGSELHTLTNAMNEIHDTLGGNMPAGGVPSYPSALPPVRPAQPHSQVQDPASSSVSPEQPPAPPPAALTSSALLDLQTKLQETQNSLSTHADKVRALEGVLAEQEVLRREVRALREIVSAGAREDDLRGRHHDKEAYEHEEEGSEDDDDDDDARSVATVVPHELESVEEEDEEQVAQAEAEDAESTQSKHDPETEAEHEHIEGNGQDDAEREAQHEQRALEDEEEWRRLNTEVGRPRTPEPTNLGLGIRPIVTNGSAAGKNPTSPLSKLSETAEDRDEDDAQKKTISQVLLQLGSLLTLTSSLEAQHAAAQSTIEALEIKVQTLEATVKATQEAAAAAVPPPPPSPPPALGPTLELLEWKSGIETQWGSIRADWALERSRREQFEGQIRRVDSGLEALAALKAQQEAIEGRQRALEEKQAQLLLHQQVHANGDARSASKGGIGLVTPPSPRSLSADSDRPRKSRSRRGRRSRSRSASRESSSGSGSTEDTDVTLASEGDGLMTHTLKARVKQEDVYEGPGHEEEDGDDTVLGVGKAGKGAETLATPESSVYLPEKPQNGSAVGTAAKPVTTRERELIQLQTAVGVLVLGIAAAAVLWRVKPET